MSTAAAEQALALMNAALPQMPNMVLGAGTVLTIPQAERAVAAGAQFIVARRVAAVASAMGNAPRLLRRWPPRSLRTKASSAWPRAASLPKQ